MLKQLFKLLGYETFKRGLHIYFEKFAWGNTTLTDFVSCLDTAHQETKGSFSVQEWCNVWLTSSGINIIEPIVEWDDSIASLTILQTCDLRGKNLLRMQKLNIGFYNSSGSLYKIEDVVICDSATVIDVSQIPESFGPVSAIFINEGEHAYAKVRFDERSKDWFVQNLHKVSDAVTRGAVWRYFWFAVLERRMTSL